MSDSPKTNVKRRQLLTNSIKLAIGIPLIGSTWLSHAADMFQASEPSKNLKILILGGTSFLGPHQIADAIQRGHSVTTFTRGKTKPTVNQELFTQVEQLTGDRENDLSALENRQWDVVFDNSGRKSEWTRKTAELLKEHAKLYVYVSSVSVYYPFLTTGADESSAVRLQDPVPEGAESDVLTDSYGVMKAKSEQEAIKVFGKGRALIIRPTFIIGPGDLTDRFIHWPVRLAKGGEILVPGKPDDPVQYIDVRDLSAWMIRLVEQGVSGTFNAVGPAVKTPMSTFIETASQAFENKSKLIQVDDYNFLSSHQIYGLVPWVAPSGEYLGLTQAANKKALEYGLTFRDLKQTVKDTHHWWYSDALTQTRRDEFEQKAGTLLAKEKELLKLWKESQSSLK